MSKDAQDIVVLLTIPIWLPMFLVIGMVIGPLLLAEYMRRGNASR